MNTKLHIITGGDNPLKGGFGYPLKEGGDGGRREARSQKREGAF